MVLIKLLCLSFLLLSSIVIAKNNKSMVKIIKAYTCEIHPKKWDPSSPMVTETSTKKVSRDLTNLFNTYNVTNTFGPVQLGARSFQIQPNAAKYLVFKMEHVNCRSPLAMKLITMSNLKFDKKCMLQQGIYKMENINLKNMTWLLKKTITANGRYSYDVEFSHAKGITSCITTIVDIYV